MKRVYTAAVTSAFLLALPLTIASTARVIADELGDSLNAVPQNGLRAVLSGPVADVRGTGGLFYIKLVGGGEGNGYVCYGRFVPKLFLSDLQGHHLRLDIDTVDSFEWIPKSKYYNPSGPIPSSGYGRQVELENFYFHVPHGTYDVTGVVQTQIADQHGDCDTTISVRSNSIRVNLP
jgi:hypothetical protein